MGKNSFISNFKRLPGAFLIALSVIATFYFIELFILPINFFTFRVWEALSVSRFLPGEFYPSMKISMMEVGDLGVHTKFAVKKKVEWETDRYGYRKHDAGINKYQVVVIGDSNAVGPGLTQNDILSEVLERRLKIKVYPFTDKLYPPVNEFLRLRRFVDSPPEIIIVESIERCIPGLPRLQKGHGNRQKSSWLKQRLEVFLKTHEYLAVSLDRAYKNNMANYFKGMTKGIILLCKLGKQKFLRQSAVDDKMLFMKEVVDNMATGNEISAEEVERISEIIASYDRIFKKKGVRFIFLPIPDKENIYYEYLPLQNKVKPKFLAKLILLLQNKGIEVIDTEKAFDEAFRQENILLYHTDDTHWNSNGVRVAADLIEKLLQRPSN